jgi:hypothetical protein
MIVSRSSERLRTFIAGRLIFGGGTLSVSCSVRDLSDTGARVALESDTTIPNRVTLVLPTRNIVREAEVRWRHAGMFGLEFIKAEAAPVDAIDPSQRIRQLEEENAKLQAQIRKLRAELANRIARDEASN